MSEAILSRVRGQGDSTKADAAKRRVTTDERESTTAPMSKNCNCNDQTFPCQILFLSLLKIASESPITIAESKYRNLFIPPGKIERVPLPGIVLSSAQSSVRPY